mmetsp:Transcript_95412/g.169387  ORF Transcript_95412/g.169387 Transcript_95412/m.169387 type:complete len:443 (+) Transcript_95412:36-1364(+)
MSIAAVLLLSTALTATAVRSSGQSLDDKLCIGCKNYPRAPNYTSTPSEENAKLQELAKDGGTQPISGEIARAVQDQWNAIVDILLSVQQGQACMDMCAVCVPKMKDALDQGSPTLKTIAVTRSKDWQDLAIWPFLGAVDATLGAVSGAINGLGVSLSAFFLGGGAVGTAAGAVVGMKTAGAAGGGVLGGAAGNLLGSLAGLSTGAVSGSVLLATTELVTTVLGAYKGVGIIGATTDCRQVGFKRSVDGEMEESLPFQSEPLNPNYGLRKLRKWTELGNGEMTSLDQNEEALKHCEHVRDHNFDLRHLADCVRHSELCDGPALVMPVVSEAQCRDMSNATFLQQLAVAAGDAKKELFAQWRRFQDMVKNATGIDGERMQCVADLCSQGGLSKALQSLHDGELTEAERTQLMNSVVFLKECKAKYKISMDSQDERQECLLVGQV